MALICGDCTGNPSNTTSLDETSKSRIQDKEARYLNLINELISKNNQLRKSVEELKERTEEQQKIIEKYKTAEKLEKQTKEQQKITEEHETAEDVFFDAKEYTE